MKQRGARRSGSHWSTKTLIGAACSALLVAGCSSSVEGEAVSPLYDPFRVGGLPVADGPSGPRDDAPEPDGEVVNSDGGEIDRLALLSLNDIEEYWGNNYDSLPGEFEPVETLVSYDSTDPDSPVICGRDSYERVNASYCFDDDVMSWDRAVFFPTGQKYFGDIAITGVLSHEYGHELQFKAPTVDVEDENLTGLVLEQQADCFAGVYLRWVAEGESSRFQLSTGDGLNHVLAGIIASRDPILTPKIAKLASQGHGTALDRIGAFRIGFDEGAAACAEIDTEEIKERRGNLPLILQVDDDGDLQTGDIEITEDILGTLMEALKEIFDPANPPQLNTDPADCPDTQPTGPATYCPANNTINVDLKALKELGETADESEMKLIQGDNTALSVVTSRYALALLKDRGAPLDTAGAAMRAACLTGVAQRQMIETIETPSGETLTLTAGDIDEAVAGLLINGQAASDVKGETVPAGFTRIVAYDSGLRGDVELCFQRFV